MHKAEQAALRELGSAMEAPQQQAGLMQVYKLAFHGTKYSITLNVQDGRKIVCGMNKITY